MDFDLNDEIREFFSRLADFAETTQRRLGWFLLIAAGFSLALAVKLYSAESALWWNLIKCGLVLVPTLIWALIWSLLTQIREAPEVVTELATQHNLSFSDLRARVADDKPGLISLFGTIREIRNNEAYESVSEAIGSVTVLANPLFMIIAFAALAILFILTLVSPFLLML